MASVKKSFADDGWAIWIEGDDTSTVYLNEWLTPKGNSYVDIAVRIREISESSNLNIYIPFPVADDEITDTSLQLRDENILRAMFSTACIIDYKKNDYTSEIAYNGRTIDIVHISCLGYTVSPLASGTLLSFNFDELQNYLDNDEAYFLFRIPHKSLDEIFRSKINVSNMLTRLRDLIMSPVVSENYGYSIRINESRLLPAEINKIGSFHRQKLKKAVVTISIDESYELNDSGCYRIRRLEKDLYKEYAPRKFKCDDAITYQWNQNRDTDLKGHFNFYFTILRSTISKSSMLLYMIILLIVSAAGNAIWDLIKYILNW